MLGDDATKTIAGMQIKTWHNEVSLIEIMDNDEI